MKTNHSESSRLSSSFFSIQSLKLARAALAMALAFSSTACVASGEESEDVFEGDSTEESQALGTAIRVVGDTSCASGYSLASPTEARANQSAMCSKLGAWDIARLADGGSMDGPGYGCTVRDVDTRSLGHSVCKKAVAFARGVGDGVCPSGYSLATSMTARANASAMCAQLGTWDIARLADGGSMDGPGYGCTIRDNDTRALGHSACAQLDSARAIGDKPCPAGSALISPQEARARQSELCSKLGAWDVARLDGGGSMDGPGYGCTIRDTDNRSLGHALCGSL